MATSTIKNTHVNNMMVLVGNDFIGKRIISRRNDSLTFTNGIATKDISSIYNGSEAFGFFFFPYNNNDVGVMHVLVDDGVAKFDAEATTCSGSKYVNWLLLLP